MKKRKTFHVRRGAENSLEGRKSGYGGGGGRKERIRRIGALEGTIGAVKLKKGKLTRTVGLNLGWEERGGRRGDLEGLLMA